MKDREESCQVFVYMINSDPNLVISDDYFSSQLYIGQTAFKILQPSSRHQATGACVKYNSPEDKGLEGKPYEE